MVSAQPSAALAPEPEAGTAEGLRVLLVDDHAVVRHALRLLLEQEADVVVVGEAEDGAAGVEAARRLRPDVVVMDMAMPVLDGVEATRRITAARPGVRVIGLSVFDNADAEQRMREAGAEHYLTKSGPSEQLLAAVRGTAGGARSGG
jgi:DNA-binding NarL/FixJ family response regulator